MRQEKVDGKNSVPAESASPEHRGARWPQQLCRSINYAERSAITTAETEINRHLSESNVFWNGLIDDCTKVLLCLLCLDFHLHEVLLLGALGLHKAAALLAFRLLLLLLVVALDQDKK